MRKKLLINNGQFEKVNSIFSKKLILRPIGLGQFGVFAKAPIKKGEIVIIQVGEPMGSREYFSLSKNLQRYPLQINDNVFLGEKKLKKFDLAEYVNHSCDPNLGILGNNVMVTIKNIRSGEEVAYDYAMSDTTEGDIGWICKCGSRLCRKVISPTDWKLPALQKRYDVYFSDYILKKIKNRKV